MHDVRVFRDGVPSDEAAELEDLDGLLHDDGAFVCIDLAGPTADEITRLRDVLGLHPLAVEDVVHRGQRPKVEFYGEHVFAVLRPVKLEDDLSVERDAEVYAFAGPRFLATFRFGDGIDMNRVAERWKRQGELMRREGAPLHVLIDEVVDGHLDAMERLEEEADRIEEEVFENRPDEEGELLERLFRVKRAVIRLRRLVMPQRQAVDLLQEDERFVARELAPYYRDVMDHVLRCVELADNVRDLLTALLELRSGQIANRLSDVAKKLSAWAGIILVPTLIAGICCMNFVHMPELDWVVGYPLALGTMALSAFALSRGFKKRGWL